MTDRPIRSHASQLSEWWRTFYTMLIPCLIGGFITASVFPVGITAWQTFLLVLPGVVLGTGIAAGIVVKKRGSLLHPDQELPVRRRSRGRLSDE